jgi:NADPH-dependent ferric siderophore reductase
VIELPPARTYSLRVAAIADVGPRTRRITVAGAELADFAALPGQDVVLHLADGQGGGVSRRYTIRHFDAGAGRMDLDVVLHGVGARDHDAGPGATWAVTAQVGDAIDIFGPRGKVQLSAAGWQLFIGDESALPAIAEMVAALPADATAVAVLEVVDADDEQLITASAAVDVRWVHRGDAPAGKPELLSAAVDDVVRHAATDRHAYVFGESRVVRHLRDQLGRAGFAPSEISAKGYWNVGRDH